MRILSYGVVAIVLVACGGGAPPPEPAAPIAPPVAQPPPPPPAPPEPPPKPADAEGTARAFVAAIGKHDADAAVRVSSEDFGRGQSRVYSNVVDATLDGPAPRSAWPHIDELDPDASLFWASFTSKDGPEKILLFVARGHDGFAVAGLRNQADRNEIAAREKRNAAPPQKLEAQGKLLTKPAKSAVKIMVDSAGPPGVGDKAELMRKVDASVPLFGGSWLVIADTEVTAVEGKTVTLKILAEKSDVKVNGKKVDHYTPGVAVRIAWSPAAR